MANQIFSFGVTNIPSGTFQIPATSIGASVTSLTLSLARCTTATPTIWPNQTTTLDMQLEVSFDNRASWLPGGSITGAKGGVELKRDGVTENPSADFTFSYGGQSPTDVRGSLTVTGGPLRTSGVVTFA